MALKDCTFTVNVGGKAQVMDYDQLRLFLIKPKNMAAVAPTFAGTGKQRKQGSGPTVLQQAEAQSPRKKEPAPEPIDLFPEVNEITEAVLRNAPKRNTSVKTGKEAREALQVLQGSDDADYQALQELKRRMSQARKPLIEGTRGKSKDQIQQSEAEFLESVNALRDAYAKYAMRQVDAIAPGGLADITWKGYQMVEEEIVTGRYRSTVENVRPDMPEDVKRRLHLGVLRFQRLAGDNPHLKGRAINIKLARSRSDMRPEYYSHYGIFDIFHRAQAPPGEGHVSLASDSSNSVIVHELGHWMEDCIPESSELIKEFLKRRAGNETLKPLAQLSSKKYGPSELAVKDEFIDPYIGRYYERRPVRLSMSGNVPDWDKAYASEVLSMGLQYMYENPLRFAEKDPEMFDLIFDIVRIGR